MYCEQEIRRKVEHELNEMKRREDKNSGLKSTERGNSLQVSNGCAVLHSTSTLFLSLSGIHTPSSARPDDTGEE